MARQGSIHIREFSWKAEYSSKWQEFGSKTYGLCVLIGLKLDCRFYFIFFDKQNLTVPGENLISL